MLVQKEGFISFCYRVLFMLRIDMLEIVDLVYITNESSDF